VTAHHTQFVVVGDVMVDTFAHINSAIATGADQSAIVSRHIGGQAANTASWLAWMQMPVVLVATRGDDSDGAWVVGDLISHGVDPILPVVEGRTGNCVVVVDAEGARTMFTDPGANARIKDLTTDLWLSAIPHDAPRPHVHLSGYLFDRDPLLAHTIIDSLAGHGVSITTSVDSAALVPTAHHRDALAATLSQLDILMGTLDELAGLLSPEHSAHALSFETWHGLGFSGTLVVKHGPAGASAANQYGHRQSPSRATHVVDTTGAGDAFAAGFLAAWTLDQEDLASALASGNEAAAVAVARIGAGPPPAEGR
jgi:sugar/nucleoside kinase (ribokinase family)